VARELRIRAVELAKRFRLAQPIVSQSAFCSHCPRLDRGNLQGIGFFEDVSKVIDSDNLKCAGECF
jgi:hypothetical protein